MNNKVLEFGKIIYNNANIYLERKYKKFAGLISNN